MRLKLTWLKGSLSFEKRCEGSEESFDQMLSCFVRVARPQSYAVAHEDGDSAGGK